MKHGPANVPADWNLGRKPTLSSVEARAIALDLARFPMVLGRGSVRAARVRVLADYHGVSVRTIQRAASPDYIRPKCPTCGR